MKIGISLLNLRIGAMGGFEIFLHKIIENITTYDESNEVVFIVNNHNKNFIPSDLNFYNIGYNLWQTNVLRIQEAILPFIYNPIKKGIIDLNLDVIFFPHHAMFPVNIPIPSVINVADIQHIYYPNYFSFCDKIFRKLIYKRSLKKCNRIIAISEFTAKSLVEHYEISIDKVNVIHHGFDSNSLSSSSTNRYVLSKTPFIYYPAASFLHKGHKNLFKSFSKLRNENKISHNLILTGVRDSNWKYIKKFIKEYNIEEFVIDYGYVDYSTVLDLYKYADIIVFPTEFEGFGLPVLEASQFNKKIICSKLEIFDEIGVPSSYQIDFSDSKQFLDAINSNNSYSLLKQPITWKESIQNIHKTLIETANLERLK